MQRFNAYLGAYTQGGEGIGWYFLCWKWPKAAAHLLVLVICLLATNRLWAQEPRASLDRETIFEGETVILTIEIEQQARNVEPDLQPLKTDFQILGQSTSTELKLIGGHQSANTKWTIELEPKRSGELRVPALKVGSGYTSPVRLKVLAQQPAAAGARAEDIFLEVQVEPKNPYVQAQVRYTVRLFYVLPLLEGALEAPSSADAVIKQLGEDTSYVATRQGRRYRVFERDYAVFPEKSGELALPAIAFRGRVASDPSPQSLADQYFNRGRRLRISSDPVVLKVRPRPENFQGENWLPAEDLTLREAWPEGPPRFRAGEPATRTLILEARGLGAAQLPELPALAIPQLRVYPDQPAIETRTETSGVVGRREERMAIIPAGAGEITLPEIRVPWWDTKTDQERVAVLPARTITVLPALSKPAQPSPSETPAPAPVSKPVISLTDKSAPGAPPAAGFWPWLSAALLGLWVLTLAIWWRERRGRTVREGAEDEPPAQGEARRALRRACHANDAPAAARALLAWAGAVWPESPPRNLGAVAARLAGDTTPVRELDRAVYAPEKGPWEGGAALWECFRQGLKRRPEPPRAARLSLPPLYPERI